MLIVHLMPTIRRHVLAVAGVTFLALVAWQVWHVFSRQESDLLTAAWLQEMMGRLRFSQYRLLPSWWLSSGLLEASRRQHGLITSGRPPWAEAVLFLGLIVSNALFLRQLAVWFAARVFRSSYSRINTQLPSRKQAGTAWLDRAVFRWAFFLSPTMRQLIVKDLRVFRRDPVQWTQFLIFFGLLGLYFLNVRRFGYHDQHYAAWVNLISFLNLAVVGLILSTFTTRFIFPMISLEGRRFWILGLLPVQRETILWGKFLFAAIGSSATCSVLVVLSDVMLRVSALTLAVHLLACLTLCVGLSAIAVGLGAMLPNLREESPSKIAAGFGGTLNLVISTAYIVGVVALTAIPSHLYLANLAARQFILWGAAASILLGLVATILPLRAGFRAFRELEF
jgi:ABC-2 type transport system permease protein